MLSHLAAIDHISRLFCRRQIPSVVGEPTSVYNWNPTKLASRVGCGLGAFVGLSLSPPSKNSFAVACCKHLMTHAWSTPALVACPDSTAPAAHAVALAKIIHMGLAVIWKRQHSQKFGDGHEQRCTVGPLRTLIPDLNLARLTQAPCGSMETIAVNRLDRMAGL